MRCKKSERFLSDRLGGTLSPARSRRLDAHLEGCPSCRASLRRQEKLQASARAAAPADPGPAYWETSLVRLRAKLEPLPAPLDTRATAKPAPRRSSGTAFGVRWAWGGAASVLAAAAGLYLFVFRTTLPVEMAQMAFDDSYGSVTERIGEDADLSKELDTSLEATLGEHTAGLDGEAHHLLYKANDYLEGLSDDEVQALGKALGQNLNI